MNLETLTPALLKQMPMESLPSLAMEIRQFLIENISKTGGHIGASLGTVELALALHYVFESPDTPILWDTGHNALAHRIITGRADQFPTLNSFKGMLRFLDRNDSPHDVLSASHAGTALSTATGLATAMRFTGTQHSVIAIVGDGTLGEGMTWEGLDYIAGTDLPILIVVNDNGYSIPKTVGGIVEMLTPRSATSHVSTGDFFRALGLKYHGPIYGHDVKVLIEILHIISQGRPHPMVLHVKTEKGHGLPYAKNHIYRFHFSMPFDPATGAGASPTIVGRTYATVAAETLAEILAHDSAVVVLTPGTPYASGLESLLAQYPDRVLDVGMKEAHAVSMAAGLAQGGQKPVVCIQSTFLQRAYDQVLHDVCFLNLPVTFLVVRSGFAGFDGPTHHGLWDIPVLRSFPNMQLHYAMDTQDLRDTLTQRLAHPEGPLALLMPYEPVPDPEPVIETRLDGAGLRGGHRDGTILCLGNTLVTAQSVRGLLREHGWEYGLMVIGQLKPFDQFTRLRDIALTHAEPLRCVTLEEGMLSGGFGSLIAEQCAEHSLSLDLLRCGVDTFVPAGSKEECAVWAGLAPHQIVQQILRRWPSLAPGDSPMSVTFGQYSSVVGLQDPGERLRRRYGGR